MVQQMEEALYSVIKQMKIKLVVMFRQWGQLQNKYTGWNFNYKTGSSLNTCILVKEDNQPISKNKDINGPTVLKF